MRYYLIITLLLSSTPAPAQQRLPPQQKLPLNYVPDASTARRIAEAVWLPIYGRQIYRNRPFTAVLVADSIWQVSGALPKGYDGGVPYMKLRKRDGQILDVSHGK